MTLRFIVSRKDTATIEDIKKELNSSILSVTNTDNCDGELVVDILAIVVPITVDLIHKYIHRNDITIEFVLDDKTTIPITGKNYEAVMKKYKEIIKAHNTQ